jgi:isopentenyl diphosphate isomerase/L-lactate dehydrogenase-like FMN-dependent dehydrogenase
MNRMRAEFESAMLATGAATVAGIDSRILYAQPA